MRFIILTTLLFITFKSNGFLLSGTISDQNGPVSFASIYIENSTYGVVSNEKGQFFMQLENGKHVLSIEHVGYQKMVREVHVNGRDLHIYIELVPKATELDEAVVRSDREDPAYDIIRKAIRNRDKNNNQMPVYGCDVYIKASLEVEDLKQEDSILESEHVLDRVNFLESYSRLYFESPDRIREIKKAQRDLYQENEVSYTIGVSTGVSSYNDVNWKDVLVKNPYIFGTDMNEVQFNFYNDLVDLNTLSDRPYVSPISSTTFFSYKFRFVESFVENDIMVNKIKVIPRNKTGNLFEGWIYIEDESYAIKAIDFELNKLSLRFFKYFNIILSYQKLNDSVRVLDRQEFFYNAKKDARHINIGNTLVKYSRYTPEERYPKELMKGAEIYYLDDALEKDSTFWEVNRPIKLKIIERDFIHERDSVIKFKQSPQFIVDQDSIYNHLSFWDYTVNGIVHRNSLKGTDFYFDPLLAQPQPFAVGGYRHSLGLRAEKEWKKAYRLQSIQDINFGILNKDLRGNIDLIYTFLPKRFASVRGGYTNDYNFVNNYESILATFSRSNYIEKIAYRVGGKMEIVNGLFCEVLAERADYSSIEGLTLAKWSDEVFRSLNKPQEFPDYTDVVVDVNIAYFIGQEYIMKPYKKEVIGKAYPELGFHYTKGLPIIFNSTVNYDKLEITYRQDIKLRNLGSSKISIHTGRFFNQEAVRLTNRKFFRGSDEFFFSDPLRSFQLLGPSISTTRAYFQGQYVHQFNGVLMNKIPLINRLGLTAVGGGGILLTQDGNFRHAEAYAGIAKKFRIGRQLFKVSGFYVAADSNHSDLSGSFKFGIDFYNPYNGSWSY